MRPQVRLSTRDAARSAPTSRVRRSPREYDVETGESGAQQLSPADRARQAPAPYAGATCCVPSPIFKEARRCASDIGISQSSHSRLIVPTSRLQMASRHRASDRCAEIPGSLSISASTTRDSIFPNSLDESIERLGLKVLKSPLRSPKSNAICERMIGTIRRECLDWLIPVSETHLRAILKDWRAYYNGSRPHMALGPGVPDPPATPRLDSRKNSRHRLGERLAVRARSVLDGLHHDYSLIETAG